MLNLTQEQKYRNNIPQRALSQVLSQALKEKAPDADVSAQGSFS